MYRTITTLFLLLFLTACSVSKQEIERKIDPKLLEKLVEVEELGKEDFFTFTGICEVDLSYDMRREVEYTGARIEKYSKNVFIAIGSSVSIRRAAQLSFVNYLKDHIE